MKKYIDIIKHTAIILMLIGCVGHRFLHWPWAIWLCVVGLILWLLEVVYKAFNWQSYGKENKQNILMMLTVIIMLFITMIVIKG